MCIRDRSISGFSSFQDGIFEWLTGLIVSKGILESTICFVILKIIDLVHFYFCHIHSQIVDEKHSKMQDYRYLLLVLKYTAV